jgi:transposase
MAKAKVDKLIKIKCVTKEKTSRLIEASKTRVASRSGETEGYLIQNLVEEIQLKAARIKKLKSYLETHCKSDETQLLTTIKGIGAYSASALMAQIENIDNFDSPQKLASFFGLHPTIRQSGDQKGISRMSKRGRPGVRTILFMCASSAVMSDAHMKSIHHRHRERGKTHYQAIGVIMHKTLRIVWGILKHKQPYDPQTDVKNQQKETSTMERVRRLQAFDQDAPISRMAQKKRKAQPLNQSGISGDVRVPELEPLITNI